MLALILYLLGAVLAYQTSRHCFFDTVFNSIICAIVWPITPFTRLYFDLFGE